MTNDENENIKTIDENEYIDWDGEWKAAQERRGDRYRRQRL